MKREYGMEQPGIRLGMFTYRLPILHYRIELSELFQALLMSATCLGAVPVITDVLGIPFELAWGMVIINGFLYTLHATWGDPVVPGWITPSIPLTIAFLSTFPMGPERIQALIALQLIIAIIFIVMGFTGVAGKLLGIVPSSIKAGILMGAGFASVIGEFSPGKRFDSTPITIALCSILAYYLLFSKRFKKLKNNKGIFGFIGGLGMLPAILLAVIVGPLAGEYPIPPVKWFPLIKIPDFAGIIQTVSPFAIGWPTKEVFLAALPMAIVVYIIAFGDFVTSGALLAEADEKRQDEKIVFDANRSNIISGIRNLIESLVCAYPTLAGPLWAAVTASVAERYKDGPEKMESIFSGVGTFRWFTFIAVMVTPIVTFVQPILPAALSMTLLVQGFVCIRLAINMTNSELDKGIAGVMGAVIAAKGAAWGLCIGVLLNLILADKEERELAKKLENN